MKASPTHVTGWKNIQREFFRHSERNEKKIEGIAESMRRALVTHLAPDEEHSPQPTIPITEASMEDRAFKDYELKLDYLKSQYDRMLIRFNYFLTIEIGLFGFLGWLVFENAKVTAVRLPALLGVFVSLLWYIVAAEDRALVEVYRSRADDSARKRLGEFADDHPAEEIGSQWNGLLSWYWRPLSVTRIPVHAAWIALVLWLFLLAFGPTWLGEYIQT